MKDGSIDIQLVHSVSVERRNELFRKAIGFLEDRDDWGNWPFTVELPTENAWKCGQFTCALDPLDMLAFYEAATTNRENVGTRRREHGLGKVWRCHLG